LNFAEGELQAGAIADRKRVLTRLARTILDDPYHGHSQVASTLEGMLIWASSYSE
jgi:hypothetical protein